MEDNETEFEGSPAGKPLGKLIPDCEREGDAIVGVLRERRLPEGSEIEFEGCPVSRPLKKPGEKEGKLKPDALADAKGTVDSWN